MNILGISAYYHDSAACLVRDGWIVAAAQEERFTRKKHDFSFPKQAIAYCLREGGIAAGNLDVVAFYDKPFVKFERILQTYLQYAPRGIASFIMALPLWIREKIWIKELIRRDLGYDGKIVFFEHHESHAASAFFPSPFPQKGDIGGRPICNPQSAMLAELRSISSSRKDLVGFAHVMAVACAAIGGIAWLRRHEAWRWWLIAAAVFLAARLLWPPALLPLHKAWMALSVLLGWVVSRIVLAALFYVAFTAVGGVGRLLGKRFLDVGIDKKRASCWIKRPPTAFDPRRYERQF